MAFGLRTFCFTFTFGAFVGCVDICYCWWHVVSFSKTHGTLGDTGEIDEQSVPQPPDRFDRT